MCSDTEDLIIAVEQVFGVSIPQKDTKEIRTVGELIRFLQINLTPRVEDGCLTMEIFFRLRAVIIQTIGVARPLVRPQTKIEDIIPSKLRRKFWKQLIKEGFKLPKLVPSDWVAYIGCGAFLGIGLCLCLAYWLPSIILLPIMFLLGVISYVALGPLAIFPFPCATLGDLALYLTPARTGSGNCVINNREISKKARLVIAYELLLPIEVVSDNARFIEDLGIE